ncbi:hypothetical protein [Rhizobium sp. EC-SD404]|uniref:hypothetical protein n=1 Tax=Rhizobium sp. EC-SD404 TaxID=2038389 RepID=UPI0012581022|nr:hypothetical protein [Rhizobium sp. EC-SD404]VVT04779.1 conserved hypothetical protein [Rhizobium sp. EC-SD404]
MDGPTSGLKDWYVLEFADGANLSRPGIYEWVIEGAGSYVGKFTHASRPLKEYERNVRKIIQGRPYRTKKPKAFRPVHVELERAHREGRKITLRIVENCLATDLTSRERTLIKERGTLNGRHRLTSPF